MQDERVQEIQKKLTELKKFLSHVENTIEDNDAKDFLLHSARNSLSDVETYLLPQALKTHSADASVWFRAVEIQLQWAEKELKHAEDIVLRYGPTVPVLG
jgi:hypothetical protein